MSERLYQLVYLSSATVTFSEETLEKLLCHARESNRAAQVTGLLMVFDGNILQVLEGPENAVRETYRRISTDPRHTGLIRLLQRPLQKRDFPEWQMAFSRKSTEELETEIEGFAHIMENRASFQDAIASHSPEIQSILKTFARSIRKLT